MKIAFNFDYLHHNGLMTRLLNEIKKSAAISVLLHQEQSLYSIEAEGTQEELETLAKLVSTMVPLSLFLKEYHLNEVESFTGSDQLLEDRSSFYQIPYCPICQEKVINKTLLSFDACKVCGDSDTKISIESWLERYNSSDFYEMINTLAQELIEKKVLSLQTAYGNRILSMSESEQTQPYGVLCCDIEKLPQSFVVNQSELQTFLLIEKPSIRLKPKLQFRAYNDLKHVWYDVSLADDIITLALTQALKTHGVDLIFASHVSTLKCAVALEKPFIISTGRDLLPLRFDIGLKVSTQCKAFGFYAVGDQEKIIIDYDVSQNRLNDAVTFIPEGSKRHQQGMISFEPSHGAFESIVFENNLFGQSLCGVHLSHDTQSQIFSYSPKIGYTSMVKFQNHHQQPKVMLESISGLEESAQRLVTNFANQYETLYCKLQTFTFTNLDEVEPITELFGLASAILGMYEGKDIIEGAKTLEANAIEFGGKSGPRIDYKIIQVGDHYYLDTLTALRSAISFKLAGVDNVLLSFGFIDSLADFIATQVQMADANIEISGVTLSGNVYENRQLLMRTLNNVSPNYSIYTNKNLSMDNDNIVLGALMLGNELKG